MAAHPIADSGVPARPPELAKFDPTPMAPSGGALARALDWLFAHPRVLFFLTRRLRWVAELLGMYFVVRNDEVREAFNHDAEFPVGWGRKMEEVTTEAGQPKSGRNFILGMKRDSDYRARYTELAKAFPLAEVGERIGLEARTLTEGILANLATQGREFDAVEELIHAVPSRLCESYFGVSAGNGKEFAKWTLAASSYVFGTDDSPERTALGLDASAHLRKAIRDAIDTARTPDRTGTVVQRMVTNPHVYAPDQVLAQFFGMILGFVPTDVLAGGNILETLLKNPRFMERAVAAAKADDDELLWRCLREALRFRNINPFMWRLCGNGYTFANGRRIPPTDEKILISNQTAMWDTERVARPHVFDPYRRDEDYLVFNPGQHWCIGAYIAKAQITQTFKPLLRLPRLRAVDGSRGKMKRFGGIYPMNLFVTYGEAQ